VSLVLFTEEDLFNGRATLEIPLDRELNRTGNVWHVMLPSVDSRLLYGACRRRRSRTRGVQQPAGPPTAAAAACVYA
jgi:isoamylase